LAVVAMLVAAAFGAVRICAAFAAWALASDALDGPLARALGVASEAGAQFDSVADCALYLSAPWIALGVSPWLRANASALVLIVFAAYVVPVCYGILKFHRLTSYHTTAARVAGVLLVVAAFVALAQHVAWPLYIAAVVLAASATEEIVITFTLDQWRSEVSSLFTLSKSTSRRFRCRDVHSADPAASASLSSHSR
jgi:phosphatidylserine synthase